MATKTNGKAPKKKATRSPLAGRKPTPGGVGKVFIRAPNSLLEEVDKMADRQKDKPGRPEMIRRIVEAFIDNKLEIVDA